MSHWLVYWVLMLDNIRIVLGVLMNISIFIILMAGICSLIGNVEATSKLIKFSKTLLKIFAPAFFLLLILLGLTPSTKQMAAIYLIPKIASNKDIQQLPPKLSKLALQYVNQELNLKVKK
ncbi:hypothetical protein LCGC14_0433040 [marine sediment metagenome]|uniref:Uncharacterized protein n=1 Tax=marine sediment metagenome TaxID=412755 RepID=A0A0F9VX57_9ZZZZ